MELVNLSIGNASIIGLLGYAVVFVGLILLMIVIMVMSRLMQAKPAKQEVPPQAAPAAAAPASPAPGSAGSLKLYDTDPKDAAMVMAIVADELQTPLNELRFKSIREVK